MSEVLEIDGGRQFDLLRSLDGIESDDERGLVLRREAVVGDLKAIFVPAGCM